MKGHKVRARRAGSGGVGVLAGSRWTLGICCQWIQRYLHRWAKKCPVWKLSSFAFLLFSFLMQNRVPFLLSRKKQAELIAFPSQLQAQDVSSLSLCTQTPLSLVLVLSGGGVLRPGSNPCLYLIFPLLYHIWFLIDPQSFPTELLISTETSSLLLALPNVTDYLYLPYPIKPGLNSAVATLLAHCYSQSPKGYCGRAISATCSTCNAKSTVFLIKGFLPEDVAGGFQPQSQDSKQAEPDFFFVPWRITDVLVG